MSNVDVEVVNLNELKVKELKELCKERGLHCYVGKRELKKQELIAQLLEHQNLMQTTNEAIPVVEENETKDVNVVNSVNQAVNKITENMKILTSKIKIPKEVKNAIVNEPLPDPETFCHTKNKNIYIKNSQPGTLMAFLDENGKPRTGALVNRSSKRKVVKLVTEFGWEFIIPYDKVLWVKQGDRWPRGIYRLLKEWKNANRVPANEQQ